MSLPPCDSRETRASPAIAAATAASSRLKTGGVRVNVQRMVVRTSTIRPWQPPVTVPQKLRLPQDIVERETETPPTTLALE
jgi:hypothetical protein